ncbi:NUMOD4 domain-containing protein [Mangrovivirga sp. M17]|uniref:NUMOD4 domain-containing protein n=2 Tax=Mangrovivirga TaxID=2858886 RepID=A0ABT3RXI2_9BACT|nr:NUMOD4 domain-containing protein [Mangrovivirga halotolerans]MCX2745912.1 NUMOD4 domain-containing protein [Mangrovivirga halotolerans]
MGTAEKDYWNEEWKKLTFDDIHPDEHYEISNYGRVKSYKTKKEGAIIKGSRIKGYRTITVKRDSGKLISKYIHKLVAEHFIPNNDPTRINVIHLDYNKENNYINNLKWATREETGMHQRENPTFRKVIKNHRPYAKLSETEVLRIKKMLKRGNTRLKMIAKQFGITHTQLNRIRSGENWGHVKIEDD